MNFFDRYGKVAANYTARPHYPPALFSWLAKQCANKAVAWDCGCGSGQASHDLATRFARVIATDPSQPQLDRALPHDRIEFRAAAAEISGLPDRSVDLIFVGMAAHWFELARFYDEVRRVARPPALLALIAYSEPRIENHAVADQALQHFLAKVDPHGPPERNLVKSLYRNLWFPFDDQRPLPGLAMQAPMPIPTLATYLRSRSAVIGYTANQKHDPVAGLERELKALIDLPDAPLQIRWPMGGRVAKVG